MMTQGGPAESTNVIVYEIYQEHLSTAVSVWPVQNP